MENIQRESVVTEKSVERMFEENCTVGKDKVWVGVALRSFSFSVQSEALIG